MEKRISPQIRTWLQYWLWVVAFRVVLAKTPFAGSHYLPQAELVKLLTQTPMPVQMQIRLAVDKFIQRFTRNCPEPVLFCFCAMHGQRVCCSVCNVWHCAFSLAAVSHNAFRCFLDRSTVACQESHTLCNKALLCRRFHVRLK